MSFTFEREHPRQSVADHQILLAFLSDEEAELFYEWLSAEGEVAFRGWLSNRKESHDPSRNGS